MNSEDEPTDARSFAMLPGDYAMLVFCRLCPLKAPQACRCARPEDQDIQTLPSFLHRQAQYRSRLGMRAYRTHFIMSLLLVNKNLKNMETRRGANYIRGALCPGLPYNNLKY